MDSFYRHRDGEEEYGYHSIATYVQEIGRAHV